MERSPDARQSYVVRNALDNGMRLYSWEKLRRRLHQKKFAGMTGDVIAENLNGGDGFLY